MRSDQRFMVGLAAGVAGMLAAARIARERHTIDFGGRVVVITGAGERAFSAGADIKEFPDFMTAAPAGGVVVPGQRVLDRLADLPVPTIAAIEGIAFGGGLEVALACDLRVAAETARLGLPETSLGIFPSYGGTQRLPRLVGLGRATEIILTGERIDAQRAYEIGLVNLVVPPDALIDRAKEMIRTIASKAPIAVRWRSKPCGRATVHSPKGNATKRLSSDMPVVQRTSKRAFKPFWKDVRPASAVNRLPTGVYPSAFGSHNAHV